MTHKQRIRKNIEKFEDGTWNKFTYAHDFECVLGTVEATLNEVLLERIQEHKWERNALGLPLPDYQIHSIPEVLEIEPKVVYDLGANKVAVIYESKMNNDEHNI